MSGGNQHKQSHTHTTFHSLQRFPTNHAFHTFHYQRRLALEGGGVATHRPTPFYCHYFGHPYYLLELVCALASAPACSTLRRPRLPRATA